MLISIITVAYNSAATIRATIQSVLRQDYPNIEYIIVDGKSCDDTVGITREYIEAFGGRLRIISEKDDGLYDAMNKGIRKSSGEIIGVLNSDDVFSADDVVSEIAKAFDKDTDGIYCDVNFVSRKDGKNIIRTVCSKRFKPHQMRYGIIPPHPSFYIRRECYEKYGLYKTDYKISADFDLMARMMLAGIRLKRLDLCAVTMRNGGTSTKGILARLTSIQEIKRSCKENNIRTNTIYILLRFLYKAREFSLKNIF